jgi:hypothetical protein
VVGDQVLRTKEKVYFLRSELMAVGFEVDGVQDEVQVIAVGFDFGVMDLGQGVFDGELVEVEDVSEQLGFIGGRRAQIDPCPNAALRLEPGRIHPVDDLRGSALVLVDSNQSPTLSCSAACAAASRATGTRYGEQLT